MGYGSGATGLRVMMLAFNCNGKKDNVTPLLKKLTPKKETIDKAIGDVATLKTSGDSCPTLALETVVTNVEDVWADSATRPYKMSIVLTPGEYYAFAKDKTAGKASKALRQRCVDTLAITPTTKIPGLDAAKAKQVTKNLEQTAGQQDNVYELKNVNKVVKGIAKDQSDTLAKSGTQSKCTDPTKFDLGHGIFCSFATSEDCGLRAGCEWSDEKSKCSAAEKSSN